MFQTSDGIIKPIVYVGLIRANELLLVDYQEPPNPTKTGWWIPAPELKFGEDPYEKAAAVIADFGFSPEHLRLKDAESFVLPGGWHLIFHFTCEVSGDLKPATNIRAHRWVTAEELENMKDIAHGKWEISVGKKYLERVVVDDLKNQRME